MSGERAPRRLHAERTADPSVLRWVTHDARLQSSRPGLREAPLDSPLGELVAGGTLVAITVDDDAIVTRCASDAHWTEIVDAVRAAVVGELDRLDEGDDWLLHSTGTNPDDPSSDDIQRIVDHALGTVLALHGGSMTVTDVGPTWVQLAPDHACAGCAQGDETRHVAARAIQARYPQIRDVTLTDPPAKPTRDTPVTASTIERRRVRLLPSREPGCH